MIVNAVIEQMMKVSMNTSPHPQRDCLTGVACARVVRVDPSRDAVLDRVAHSRAGKSADCRRRAEGALKDQGHDCRDLADIDDEHAESHDDIEDRHDRHRAGHDVGDPPKASPDRHDAGDADDDDRPQIRDAKSLPHGTRHRLGLHAAGPGAEEEAEYSQDDRSLLPSERVLEHEGTVADIFVHRLLVVLAVALPDDDLAGLRGHAEESGYPHPHERARSAADDCRCHAADIAGPHGVGQCCAGRAETGDGAFSFALGSDLAVSVLKVERDLPLVAEREPDAQDNPHSKEQDRHPGPPHKVVQLIHQICQCLHVIGSPSLPFFY